jgi:ADP-glucose pyrophosphorylase
VGLPPGLGGCKSGLRALRELWLNLQSAYELRRMPDVALCSMGIYVFETSFLIDLLRRDAADQTSSHGE